MNSIMRLMIAMLVATGIGLSAVACSTEGNTQNGTIEITDQLGRTVALNDVPQRIISLAPANTEILFALGLGDKIVGVTEYCNYPSEALEKEKVGGFSTPDIEKIVMLQPDVVLAAPIHEATVIPQLESLGIKVVALAPETIEETYDAIILVGNVTGDREAADSLVTSMEERISSVATLVANLKDIDRPDVFYIVWHNPLMTAGGNTLPGQLIELAGGNNIFSELSDYATVSLESLVYREPDVIIVGTGMGSGADAPLQWAKNESRLQGVPACKDGNIFSINTDLTGRFGPRIVDALEEIFKLIHPELAEELK